jgi:predicted secreted hydrolase
MKNSTFGRAFVVLGVLASCWCQSALPAEAGQFRQALPGYVFSFPRDHYSHDEYRTEWWYYTGHLKTEGGEEYGYQVTFFRSGLAEARQNPSRWAARNLYLSHFAISDIPRKTFRYFEHVSRGALGEAGASETELHVWIGDWEVKGEGATQRLRARDEGFAVDLSLTALKPPVINGVSGISRKGAGQGRASHYYSMTRLKTEGTLTVDGRSFQVTGLSWMDHEFGSAELGPGQVGWDWFSLQLHDSTELMLYLIRRKDGSPDPYSAGTWAAADGRSTHLALKDFRVEVLDRWRSPKSSGVYPMRWRIHIPAMELEVVVTPALRDQELITTKSTQVTYWEGAVSAEGRVGGRSVTGQGYVEMTGYAGAFRKRL